MEVGGENHSESTIRRTIYFPEPIKTDYIQLDIEEGDYPLSTKIDFLGTTAENSYWTDPALEPRLLKYGKFAHLIRKGYE